MLNRLQLISYFGHENQSPNSKNSDFLCGYTLKEIGVLPRVTATRKELLMKLLEKICNRGASVMLTFASLTTCLMTYGQGLQSSDLLRMRSVSGVELSPDAKFIAYTVINYDGPGRPYSQLWLMNLSDGKSIRLAREKESASDPIWSQIGRASCRERVYVLV